MPHKTACVKSEGADSAFCATFRAAAFPGRRERSLCLFLVAWEGHQADKKAK